MDDYTTEWGMVRVFMGSVIAEIFSSTKNLDQFRASVLSLKGDFPFGSDSMVDLGNVYFTRYPDKFSNRNMEEVQLGYSLVRICAVEKMVLPLLAEKRDLYRSVFRDVAKAGSAVAAIIEGWGRESALEDHRVMASKLQGIKQTIDEIPRGMIKERFIGGVSNLFNILYVIKMTIDKAVPG